MHIGVVSLFPEMVSTIADYGVVGRARQRELVTLEFENPRDFADDTHRTVDDATCSGNSGEC